jgi:hypothetical protein
MILDIDRAIKAINENAIYTYRGSLETIDWLDGTTPISPSDIEAKITELNEADEVEKTNKENLKASAKAKLMAGEALTEDEANVMIGG